MPTQEINNKSHFLPEHQVTGFTTVTNTKVFEDKGVALLNQVSEAITVSNLSGIRTVSSIPTIFARPLLFKMALFDGNHPLHDEITDEWRGLMSCFILADILGLEISFRQVEFNSEMDFFKAYLGLKPDTVRLGKDEPGSIADYDWRTPYLIIFKIRSGNNNREMVVGGTSPSTLFYTSPDYTEVAAALEPINLTVRTKSNEGLKVFSQPQDDNQILVVYHWLDKMIGSNGKLRTAFTDNNSEARTNILRLFVKWKEDIEEYLHDRNLDIEATGRDLDIPSMEWLVNSPLSITANAITRTFWLYRFASAPMIRHFEGEGSDLFLAERNSNDNLIVVCDESLAIDDDLMIYNNFRKSNIGPWRECFRGDSGGQLRGTDLPPGTKWIVPARYFLSNTLLRVKGGKPFEINDKNARSIDGTGFGERISGGHGFVLPFNKKFLSLFSGSENLLDNARPSFEQRDDEIVFSFNLKIKFSGETRVLRVSKVYSLTPDGDKGRIAEIEAPPQLAFWPHFYHERWSRYFVYKRKQKVDEIVEVDFKPHSFNVDDPLTRSADLGSFEIMEISRFPDAMIVKHMNNEVGCLLINRIPIDNNENRIPEVSFGVDFGTSNTNIWWKNADAGNNICNVLAPRVFPRVITHTDLDAIYVNLASNFFPYDAPNIPFATIFKKQIPVPQYPILDGIIQFISKPELNKHQYLETNIKWGGNAIIRSLFIDHLLLLLFAEAKLMGAERVNFFVSYPLAYSDDLRQAYIASFNNSVMGFAWLADPDIQNPFRVNAVNPNRDYLYTESVAVGKYFSKIHGDATIAAGAICIDVGGGTSDLSIWSRRGIVYQSSLYLAGNTVSNCFRRSAPLRNTLFGRLEKIPAVLTESILDPNLNNEDSFFSATFNLVLKQNKDKVNLVLPELQPDIVYKKFRTILIVEYAAIVFYSGMIIKKLRSDDPNLINQIPKIFWGGGASAFVKWIDYGLNISPRATSYKFFSEILKSAFYSDKEIAEGGAGLSLLDCRLTNDPKSECASGLLAEVAAIGEAGESGFGILGEDIILKDGSIVDHTSELSARMPRNAVLNPNHEEVEDDVRDPGVRYYSEFQSFVRENGDSPQLGSRFINFIKILNFVGRNYGLIDRINLREYPQLENNISAQMQNIAILLQDGGTQTVRVEPVFMIEVKELLKEMIDGLPQ